MAQLIAFNKPYGVLSQFTDAQGRPTLSDYISIPAVYPAGRLDMDSEGLLLLTDNATLKARISDPRYKLEKHYLVQVEGTPDPRALTRLETGVNLKDGRTRPAAVRVIAKKPGWLWPRKPPIRQRKSIPVSWLQLVIREGKNRQVRRMTAAVGLPTLRLIRIQIGDWRLGQLQPGDSIQLPPNMESKPSTVRSPQ